MTAPTLQRTLRRRAGFLALIAALGFGAALAPAPEAEARPAFRQLAKAFLKSGGKPSVDIRVAVQTGRRDCSKTLNQNADINLGFVIQRCANNRAVVNQGGLFNKGKVNQR